MINLVTLASLMTWSIYSYGAVNEAALLESARASFKKQQYSKAIDTYRKIPRDSLLWPVSLEESAWTYLANQQEDLALATTKTLIAFPLNQMGFYESYLIQGIAELKSCRYDGVFKTIDQFKKNQLTRIQNLEQIAEGKHKLTYPLIKAIRMNDRSLNSLLPKLPELSHLDLIIYQQAISKNANKNLVNNRLKELAKQELAEIKTIMVKLQILKVEAEQRVIRDAKLGLSQQNKSKFKETDYNQMIFPVDDEPWIDELGQFEVAMKACQQQRRKL